MVCSWATCSRRGLRGYSSSKVKKSEKMLRAVGDFERRIKKENLLSSLLMTDRAFAQQALRGWHNV